MAPASWWRDGVLYQIYPRSFADSDGDGIGDLRGITERLDHLEWLGVDGIWLNPTFPSPNDDWGYDVADYKGVHPDLGTLEDLDELIAEAGQRGIRVLLDLVPNHTSDRHAWFQDALSGRDAPLSATSTSGPTRRPAAARRTTGSPTSAARRGRCTSRPASTTSTSSCPPSPTSTGGTRTLREAIDDVLRFWFDRGVAGFRIDVCHAIVKDRELRDDPQPEPGDHPQIVKRGLKQVYSMNRPELHDVLRRWRALTAARDGDEPMLVGETYVLDLEQLIPFYGHRRGRAAPRVQLPVLPLRRSTRSRCAPIVEGVERMLPEDAWPVWTGSNHDGKRFATRWAGGDPGAHARGAADPARPARHAVPLLRRRDRAARHAAGPGGRARPRGARGSATPRRTATSAARRCSGPTCRAAASPRTARGRGCRSATWPPHNVEAQREDPGSVLHLVRDLIALRRARSDLRDGAYETLPAPDGAWAWRRGAGTAVAVNLGDAPVSVEGLDGPRARRDGPRARRRRRSSGALELAPGEGAVLELA